MIRKLYISLTIVITLCILTGCSPTEIPTTTVKLQPAQIAAAVQQSDTLFTQREDLAKLKEAVTVLGPVRDRDTPDFETEWRFARLNYFLGKQTVDKKEASAIFGRGRDAGATAARVNAARPEGHFWFGANLGELARMDPFTVGLKSVDDIRSAMNKVIEIQPEYQHSSAYDVLAQVELETRLTGGSAAKAAELIEKALATERDNTNLHLHLATAYLALHKKEEARKQLEHILQMKPNPEFVIEYREGVAQAKKMLATKF